MSPLMPFESILAPDSQAFQIFFYSHVMSPPVSPLIELRQNPHTLVDQISLIILPKKSATSTPFLRLYKHVATIATTGLLRLGDGKMPMTPFVLQ